MRTPTFLPLVLILLAAAGCPNRGTGPSSMEVGGACEGNNPFASCEELCIGGGLQLCTMGCTGDEDCPAGSVCTRFGTIGEPFVCLPLCSAAPCEDYAQGYCCGPIRSSDNKKVHQVCLTDSLKLSDGSTYPFSCGAPEAHSLGSCNFPGQSKCDDVYMASQRATRRESCIRGGFQWSDLPCATEGRIASCDARQYGIIVRFYPGTIWTEESCNTWGGYWIVGDTDAIELEPLVRRDAGL